MLSMVEPLSKRENQVYTELLKGKSLEKIAQDLQISRSTIATHTMNIYGKRCVNSRVELLVRRINELEALINEKWNSRGTN